MNPVLAMFAQWLELELHVLLPLAEHEIAARVRAALQQKWVAARPRIVKIVNVHDGLTLDPSRLFTGKDGKVWTHPQAFVRDCAFWQWHQLPFGGTGADFIRDLETADLIATVLPGFTLATAPEEAYDAVVAYQMAHLPF